MSPLSIAAPNNTSFLNSNFQVYINHAPSPKQPLKCDLPSPPNGSEDTPFNSLSSAANPPNSSDYSAKNLVEEILITPNGYHLKLLRILGQGAQGVVYHAELLKRQQTDRQEMSFAVKYIHSRALGMAEYKFHQLCDSHPNVVKLYDICTISHLPGIFLILEFCPLGSLYDHLTALNLEEGRGGWFSRSSQQHWLWFDQNQEPTAQSIHLFREICQAVQHCHYRGVAHRDIKPENILLKSDAHGVLHAKLSDFGLATTHLDKNTEFNHGSEMYMAPEVYRTCFLKHQVNFANLNSVKMWSTTDLPAKSPVVGVGGGVRNGAKSEEMVKKRKRQGGGGGYDAKRADIWSLGIVLINLITGKAPWYKANFQDDLFWRFIANPFDTLSTCLDLTPEGIRVVCATLGISYGVQLAPLKQGKGRCSNPLELIAWASLVKTWRRPPPPCTVLETTTQIAQHENK